MSGHDKPRNQMPVFVVGSPRSGTTLLYDMLMSAGGFAVYLGESSIFNAVAPRFGDLRLRKNRLRMWNVWLGSKLFRASAIDPKRIEKAILNDCRNAGDFLRAIMEEISRNQNAIRWAGNTPEEILYIPLIKETIPEALFVHVIRDGRDVALSLSRKRYIRPFPWRERETVLGAAIYWEWIVAKGRSFGKRLGADYVEIKFENLISHPGEALASLGSAIHHELDYERIRRTALGSVTKPNTSFNEQLREFNPIGRWAHQLTPPELENLESLIGNSLVELDYSLATPARGVLGPLTRARLKLLYRAFFEAKLHAKNNAVVRMLRPEITSAQLDEIVIADEDGPQKLRQLALQH